ncbi:copper resistance CopC family protein [Microbacterium rhizophilus]|uniref:copper resistance CopC family protein n=1 Tax=Microbacterium rhizophilus TaxID=3138934 RepID=UPI0031F16D6B
MPVARSPRPHRLVVTGAAALSVGLGVLLAASPAAAHDSLISTDPATDSTVETMPEEISLSFSSALLTMSPQDTVVDVISPSGQDVSEGDAVVDGAVVRQAIGEAVGAGAYTVNWHVVSGDGHPTEGSYSFAVTTASEGTGVAPENDETQTAPPPKPVVTPTPTKEAPSAAPTTASAAPAPSENHDRSFGEVLPWILLGVTGIAIVGALIAVLVTRGRGGSDDDAPDEDRPDQV